MERFIYKTAEGDESRVLRTESIAGVRLSHITNHGIALSKFMTTSKLFSKGICSVSLLPAGLLVEDRAPVIGNLVRQLSARAARLGTFVASVVYRSYGQKSESGLAIRRRIVRRWDEEAALIRNSMSTRPGVLSCALGEVAISPSLR